MKENIFKAFSIAGVLFWLAVAVGLLVAVVYRLVSGSGDAIIPLIALILMAINYNISTIVTFRKVEMQALDSVLLKTQDQEFPNTFQRNPHLN